ncbi:uncharacterized protein LOC107213492 [Parus major]|uniref:uncharacterized protein LOC107213492 n=1 Tax=Parus major TaxID=9157 RepID=UPI000771677A|nr:uncharacterized protein LOC107213492 [Parus major]XP_015503461.1 uncharacterized protein LOC107213492 [Parus major]XP_015503463.1 uncharacterized protein LOC107213492 [Parus major]XP_015503464.1 uncharacterized protein LOC107213492 [Parus major]XP_015503465.1 uncharacterized protein LOC107213492 [Parus major]XP_015503469.1 uncharacterized protein LOC107213492 [Parus major]XP_015503470.1 uncharacterized protein LOC107213492 [Parus major]
MQDKVGIQEGLECGMQGWDAGRDVGCRIQEQGSTGILRDPQGSPETPRDPQGSSGIHREQRFPPAPSSLSNSLLPEPRIQPGAIPDSQNPSLAGIPTLPGLPGFPSAPRLWEDARIPWEERLGCLGPPGRGRAGNPHPSPYKNPCFYPLFPLPAALPVFPNPFLPPIPKIPGERSLISIWTIPWKNLPDPSQNPLLGLKTPGKNFPWGWETTGIPAQEHQGKSLGLGHPTAMDLGIFDCRCSRFSRKIPHEGENGGAGVGHGDLGGFYPKFLGIEAWVTPKLCPGVFSRTKEDPGGNLGVPDGNQALPAKPQPTKSGNLCNSWIFPPFPPRLQSFGKSPGSRDSWNQIPIYSGLGLFQIHRHGMIQSRTFPFGCRTPKFCSSHQFFHGKTQHSQHSAFPAFPHSLATDWSIPLDGSHPWMRRVMIFGKLGIVSRRFNSSDASLEKKTKPGFLKFPHFQPFPNGNFNPSRPGGRRKIGNNPECWERDLFSKGKASLAASGFRGEIPGAAPGPSGGSQDMGADREAPGIAGCESRRVRIAPISPGF